MSRVIKADYTRMIPSEELPAKKKLPPAEAAEVDEDAPFIPANGAETAPAEVQAAYEDLLSTAQNEVALMMEDAQRTARQILDEAAQDAEAQIEQFRRQGYEEGYENGLSEGQDMVRREAKALFSKAQGNIDRTLSEAYTHRDRLLTESEPRILRLSLDIARKILGYELTHNEEAFMGIVKEAVSSLTGETQVTLHVSSQEFMKSFDSQETLRIPTAKGSVMANVKIDPAAQEGGCIVETETGTMDVSAEAQLEQIALNLGIDQSE